ncbi:endoribonuclease ysh1 [Entomophthora muscae]|uniref:Endoribonuclease ysh1 n=1 Tax=Entomophthora muscae TaxID=34485 RepID=A0ACC2RZN6_9FUNG|nr:endoribonuclease ysh1 [Entomophthora muscae]
MLFDEQDLLKSYEKISVVDYRQEVEVDGIKFTPFNAGHVLGAAMFLIEIAGIKVLYTGDYSREEDRHLMAAERPPNVTPEVLICEATYGNQIHEPRLDREARFTSRVQAIVQRGGRCLIPVFALGRAQELLLILDEYWQAHPELDQVPIYFASSLAKKCMAVYQTYINMMNSHIRQQFSVSNPFIFKHISNLRHVTNFDDSGPCVMVASPGMLQNGLSRELFERWCPNPLNGLVLCGYSVEGTLARSILSSPETVPSLRGTRLMLRMSVDYVSFSAHVDFAQNAEFIDQVASPNLVLVHGEPIPMGRLRAALSQKYLNPNDPASTEQDSQPRRRRMAIFTPRNTETVRLHFRSEKLAKTVGRLAEKAPQQGNILSGVLVGRDFQYRLMDPADLNDLAGLPTASFHQRQKVVFRAKFSLLVSTLTCMFGTRTTCYEEKSLIVMGVVTIYNHTDEPQPYVLLEWEGNEANDMVADGVLAAILTVATSPASIKLTKSAHSHTHSPPKSSASLIMDTLKGHFDTIAIETLPPDNTEVIRGEFNGHVVLIDPITLSIVTLHTEEADTASPEMEDPTKDEPNTTQTAEESSSMQAKSPKKTDSDSESDSESKAKDDDDSEEAKKKEEFLAFQQRLKGILKQIRSSIYRI